MVWLRRLSFRLLSLRSGFQQSGRRAEPALLDLVRRRLCTRLRLPASWPPLYLSRSIPVEYGAYKVSIASARRLGTAHTMELSKKISAAELLAKQLRNNLFVYAAFLVYALFIIATTDDLDFIVSKQIKLPIINLELPLVGTFIVAPI